MLLIKAIFKHQAKSIPLKLNIISIVLVYVLVYTYLLDV